MLNSKLRAGWISCLQILRFLTETRENWVRVDCQQAGDGANFQIAPANRQLVTYPQKPFSVSAKSPSHLLRQAEFSWRSARYAFTPTTPLVLPVIANAVGAALDHAEFRLHSRAKR
jgi:hypothetical protein